MKKKMESPCCNIRPKSAEGEFWNNWTPTNKTIGSEVGSRCFSKSYKKLVEQRPRLTWRLKNLKEVNLIPPQIEPVSGHENQKLFSRNTKEFIDSEISGDDHSIEDSFQSLNLINLSETCCFHEKLNCLDCTKPKTLEINIDWGPRMALNDVFHMNEGSKIWNIIRRGLFAQIKVWSNEYGNIKCKALGKITVVGMKEKSVMEINSEENFRKMLGLSHVQWSAVCETLQEKRSSLNFDAFDVFDPNGKSSLEKLWYFVCKRRHFLPNVSVLCKISGAVKLQKEFNIVPKIIIMEVRDIKGHELD